MCMHVHVFCMVYSSDVLFCLWQNLRGHWLICAVCEFVAVWHHGSWWRMMRSCRCQICREIFNITCFTMNWNEWVFIIWFCSIAGADSWTLNCFACCSCAFCCALGCLTDLWTSTYTVPTSYSSVPKSWCGCMNNVRPRTLANMADLANEKELSLCVYSTDCLQYDIGNNNWCIFALPSFLMCCFVCDRISADTDSFVPSANSSLFDITAADDWWCDHVAVRSAERYSTVLALQWTEMNESS